MSLGGSHRISGRTGLLSRETLALVLVLGAFVFSGREAWAKQVPREEVRKQSVAEVVVSQHTVEIDGEVVEPAAGTPPIEEKPVSETLPAEEVSDPVIRNELVVDPKPEPAEPEPAVLEPTPVVDTNLAPEPAQVEPEVSLETEPVPPVEPWDPIPEPPIFEENEALPASIVPTVPEEEYWTPSEMSSAADDIGEVKDGSVPRLAEENEGWIFTALGTTGGEADITPERTESSGSPEGNPESPSRSAPRPSSPFVLPPVGGGAIPLTGSDVGSSGVHLLLLCVLVSGLVLFRRDGGLSWGFWEPPKPSSALLLPLERPG